MFLGLLFLNELYLGSFLGTSTLLASDNSIQFVNLCERYEVFGGLLLILLSQGSGT